MEVAAELEKLGKPARVVSMPCTELFDVQPEEYRNCVLGGDIGSRVSIEAAGDMCWYKYIGLDGLPICMEGFGASAPAGVLAKEFGFTVDAYLGETCCSMLIWTRYLVQINTGGRLSGLCARPAATCMNTRLSQKI